MESKRKIVSMPPESSEFDHNKKSKKEGEGGRQRIKKEQKLISV